MKQPSSSSSIQQIHSIIDNSLSNYSSNLKDFNCRRGLPNDVESINQLRHPLRQQHQLQKGDFLSSYPPHYYFILLEGNKKIIKGIAIWYIGYSTWKGKVMNLDTLYIIDEPKSQIVEDNEYDILVMERMLMNAIIHIAKSFEFSRIVYQVQGIEVAKSFQDKYKTDLLHEWLTLQMGRDQIISFLNHQRSTYNSDLFPMIETKTFDNNDEDSSYHNNIIALNQINDVIDDILFKLNISMKQQRNHHDNRNMFQLRRAYCNDDAGSILNLVNGLATYEKALDEVHVNESIYKADGGGDNPLFHCIILESREDNHQSKGQVTGMAFFYFGYSLQNRGRFLYLEDLFIQEKYRGNGFGKAFMYALAKISNSLDCERFVWQALDWNSPALNFYAGIGAEICQDLITLRFDKDRILASTTSNRK